ncbi:MAG TPA: multidrug effflux MFS transporter [Victivallales bacterium]|nr:multidrug effflux MFS transporter [Victivallales bacterium]
MKNFKYIFYIIVLTATLGQFFSDLYIPSLSAISKSLKTTISSTQLTITLYMLGYSISSLIYGPLSDTIGRRKPLLIGLSFCLVGSAVCSLAPNISTLISGRLLQGLGGGVGISVTQAIIRDSTKGEDLSRFNSYLAIANVSVIISAPILGGFIQEYLYWKANFHFLLIYSILVGFLVFFFIPETKSIDRRTKFKIKQYSINLLILLKSTQFRCCQITLFSLYGCIMAWMTIGPILLLKYLHFTPGQFGLVCGLTGIAYSIGAFANGKLLPKFGIKNMLIISKFFLLASSVIMFALACMGLFNFFVIIMPLLFFFIGSGLMFPNIFAIALTPFGRIAGFAASFIVASQIFGGFISSLIAAMSNDTTQFILSIILLLFSVIILISGRILLKCLKKSSVFNR